MYWTTHDVNVTFCMPKLSIRKIIEHHFHVDNIEGELGIGFDMIIFRDLMVQLGPLYDFKHKLIQKDDITVPMKELSGLLGQTDLTSHGMREVAMQTSEPVSKIEATEKLVKILYSTYASSDLKHVADNITQMNSEERTQLLRILKDCKDLFDCTIGDWYTDPLDLGLNPYYKLFNCKCYPVPRITKEKILKEIKLLLKI